MADDYFSAAPALPSVPVAPQRSRTPVVLGLGVALAAVVVAGALTAADDGAAATSPLRQVTEPAPASAGWSASYVDDAGRPARWDPCTPIRYVVQPRWMPERGRADLAEALRRITAVSGLQFVDGGDTDEVPSTDRPAVQPDRYGEGWAPVLVAWVPPSQTDLRLGGGVQGLAVASALPGAEGGHIVTAQVALDADRRLPSGFGPGSTEGEVLLHELTHVVGLGHVDDATQVMSTTTTNSESAFGAGDRAGLAAVGAAGGCHPAPRPS